MYSSGTKARAYGSARAAKAGSKVEYFNCTLNGVATISFEANESYSHVFCFYPALGGVNEKTGIIKDPENGYKYGGIVNDRTFRMKCASYDEVKIVSMKVKLQPSSLTSASQVTVYSICDRKASDDEVMMDDSSMDDIASDTPSVREICESPGSIATPINVNRISSIVRSVNCRDLMEKSVYTDATISYNPTQGESPVNYLAMVNELNFSPAMYFCVKSNTAQTSKQVTGWTYTVEYNCIFRNPKSDLQTFIVKENPDYKNPAGRSSSSKYVFEEPTEVGIPGRVLYLNGVELSVSKWRRYLARSKMNEVAKISSLAPLKVLDVVPAVSVSDVVVVKDEEPKKDVLMDVEDDPGTS